MSKSTPLNSIETVDDDQTIQQVLESLDIDTDEFVDEEVEEVTNKNVENVKSNIKDNLPGIQLPNLTKQLTDIVIVFGVFLFVSQVPIEQLVYRYISIEHVPMSKTVIKAIIAAILFGIFQKIIKFI
jgi:hypothetical protein